MNLTQPGGRNRMTFRLETSRRIDLNSSPQGGLPSSRNPPTLTHLAEAEILDLNDLGKRRRIVNLGDRHVRRTDPRLVIGLHRGLPAQMYVKLCPFAPAPAREHGQIGRASCRDRVGPYG